MPTDHVIGQS